MSGTQPRAETLPAKLLSTVGYSLQDQDGLLAISMHSNRSNPRGRNTHTHTTTVPAFALCNWADFFSQLLHKLSCNKNPGTQIFTATYQTSPAREQPRWILHIHKPKYQNRS